GQTRSVQTAVKGREVMTQNLRMRTMGRITLSLLLLGLLAGGAARKGAAQVRELPPPPLPVDPTPIKDLLSDTERATVADARSYKKTVEAYLTISDSHLDAAVKAVDEGGTGSAERELDISTKSALEACQIAFDPKTPQANSGNRAALGKRIEQRLYAQIRKLEAIQRRFPIERIGFADRALDFAKRMRDHALDETLALGEVLTEKSVKKKEVDSSQPPEYFRSNFRTAGNDLTAARPARPVSYQDSGDYLSGDEEDEVKEAQDIDKRAKVFMKIADRRLHYATGTTDQPSTAKPDPNKRPHELRKGEADETNEGESLEKLSRAELLRHYARAIEELMDKLEDAHERNPKSSALKRALNILADDTDRQLKTLKELQPDMRDEAESKAMTDAIAKAEEANTGAREALKATP
ncbi:MAG TPA: hypothetical protein VI756_02850, partial [Blastocatellia bacterium]